MERCGYNLFYSVACVPKLDECFLANCVVYLFFVVNIMFKSLSPGRCQSEKICPYSGVTCNMFSYFGRSGVLGSCKRQNLMLLLHIYELTCERTAYLVHVSFTTP